MATCIMALSNAAIIESLTAATADLFWISETDAPFEVLLVDVPLPAKLTAKKLLKCLKHEAATPIATCDLDTFFQPVLEPQDWHEEEDKENIKRYENVIGLIKQHLTEPQVYRVGAIDITIYILGKTPDNQWVALKTQAVET
jgi:Nuclease A inhibitor-like protein